MFTDELRRSVWDQIRQSDLRPFASVLTPQMLSQAAANAGVAMGRGALNLGTLAWLAVSAALRPGLDFRGVLTHAFGLLSELGRLPSPPPPPPPPPRRPRRGRQRGRGPRHQRSKHDPRKPPSACPSEEAFTQARKAVPPAFWAHLLLLLGRLFESRHSGLLSWNGFRLLLLDGTCVTLDRWRALGGHFGYARNKGGAPRPQARMVMLMLGTVRLPWGYELTPRSQGESTVAARLLLPRRGEGGLRRGDLLLMDRGFFHYGLFCQVRDAGAFFAIRRTKRLRFRVTRRISGQERVVRWTPAARRWHGGTIDLRVIDYQINGFRKSAIVTNLLDERRVTAGQLLGLSRSEAWVTRQDAGLYHQRWEIETAFRELKCVQEMKGKLRGRTPEAIHFEVAGHVLLYLLVRFLMVEAAAQHGGGLDPLSLGFTNALRQVKLASERLPVMNAMTGHCGLQSQGQGQGQGRALLANMLRNIAEHVVPLRPSRHYPRPKDAQPRRTGAGHAIPHAKLSA